MEVKTRVPHCVSICFWRILRIFYQCHNKAVVTWNFQYISTCNSDVSCRCINFSPWTQGSQITTENKQAWPEKWDKVVPRLQFVREERGGRINVNELLGIFDPSLSFPLSFWRLKIESRHTTRHEARQYACVCVCVYMPVELFSSHPVVLCTYYPM